MSRLGESVLLALNRLMPEPNRAQLAAKSSSLAYNSFFQNRSTSSFATFGHVDLTGQRVLDLGCGLGANLVHICDLGAQSVSALDIDGAQMRRTRSLVAGQYPELVSRVRFVSGDAARLPFDDRCLDAIISADTFEHVQDPEMALRECCRVLRPGGRLYGYFPPFYAPWGAHMVNWIRLPWCQVLFAEPTVVRAARRLEAEGRAANNRLPPETRLDLLDGDTIPFVNCLTVERFTRAVDEIPGWEIILMRRLPPLWRKRNWLSALLAPLAQAPLLGEMFTARVAFVLEKAGDRA